MEFHPHVPVRDEKGWTENALAMGYSAMNKLRNGEGRKMEKIWSELIYKRLRKQKWRMTLKVTPFQSSVL